MPEKYLQIGTFKNDKLHGPSLIFDHKEKVKAEGNYWEGQQDGIFKHTFEDGCCK